MHFSFMLVLLGAILGTVNAATTYVCNSLIYKNLPLLVNYAPFVNYCRAKFPVSTVTVYLTPPSKRSPEVEADLIPRAQVAPAQDPRQAAWNQLQSQGVDAVRIACACVQVTPTVTVTSRTSATPSPTKTDNSACLTFLKSDPTCGDYQWQSFFTGSGVRSDRNTYSGNSMAGYPAYTNLLQGNLQSCQAIQACASLAMGRGDIYFSFDVHYKFTAKVWECFQYVNQGLSSDYSVKDTDTGRSFGYNVVA